MLEIIRISADFFVRFLYWCWEFHDTDIKNIREGRLMQVPCKLKIILKHKWQKIGSHEIPVVVVDERSSFFYPCSRRSAACINHENMMRLRQRRLDRVSFLLVAFTGNQCMWNPMRDQRGRSAVTTQRQACHAKRKLITASRYLQIINVRNLQS